jgi:DNA helicase-2/ATP-dependent DNA helicase PcrA
MRWTDHLNDEQLAVVLHGDGPVQVRAGPGSGKTRALTFRIAYLVDERIARASEVLALTFTRKAGEEMRSRVDELLHAGAASAVTATHFHSFGYGLLRSRRHESENRLLRAWDGSSVAANTFYERLWRKACAEAKVTEAMHHMTAASIVSSARNDGVELDAFRRLNDRRDNPSLEYQIAAKAWEAYEDLKMTAGKNQSSAIDFDDMIVLTEAELRCDDRLRRSIVERFRWVLIDECQDLNVVQWRIVQHIAPPRDANVLAVGDLDQGIYAFRGARPTMMLEFDRVYDATIYNLERNYRSTRSIVSTALRLIKYNRGRQPKELWTENPPGLPPELAVLPDAESEGAAVGALLREELAPWLEKKERGRWDGSSGGALDGRTMEPADIAILVRCWWLTRAVEDELLSAQIPYVILGGTGFYGRREIRDVLAYLEVAVALSGSTGFDPVEAGLRVLNVPNRYLGRAARGAIETAVEKQKLSILQALRFAAYSKPYMRQRAGELAVLFERLGRIVAVNRLMPEVAVALLVEEVGYVDWLDDYYDDAADRKDNVAELIEAAGAHTSVENLVRYAKMAALPSKEREEEAVQVMTIHRSKGKEWPLVVLVGASEGVLPHEREENVDEERRLAYVAMTRAEQRLYVTSSMSYREQARQPSRFLFESGFLAVCEPCQRVGYARTGCETCNGRGWTRTSSAATPAG